MIVIDVRNVQEALPRGVHYLRKYGELQNSRAGQVLVAPAPVTTVYQHPRERLLFWPERDANPFFHMMEALWMLAGRNDVEWLARFNSRMTEFSDDGETFHGAYGYRWRYNFWHENVPMRMDQLDEVCQLLQKSPETRRAVIQMWNCESDLITDESASKDIPCNTQIYLSRRGQFGSHLDMTVCCRSNDIVWGAYGANAVHFSILQEYLASRIGVGVGTMYQISNNYHAYLDVFRKVESLGDEEKIGFSHDCSPYTLRAATPIPLMTDLDSFEEELLFFMSDADLKDPSRRQFRNPFLMYASCLKKSYLHYKESKSPEEAMEILDSIKPRWDGVLWDFHLAAQAWLIRRIKNKQMKALNS